MLIIIKTSNDFVEQNRDRTGACVEHVTERKDRVQLEFKPPFSGVLCRVEWPCSYGSMKSYHLSRVPHIN